MDVRASYPVALVLGGRSCLVVGGGRVARLRAAAMLEAGARLTIVAPAVDPGFELLPVHIERRVYRAGEAANYWLVCTTTGIPAIDGQVFADAERAGVLVNAADDPEHCSYLLPAVLRQGPVTISVSTAGTSPALARWLRDRLRGLLDVDAAQLAQLVGHARTLVRDAGYATEGLAWARLLDELTLAIGPLSDAEPEAIVAAFVDAALERGGGERDGSGSPPG